jgi:hypothetical protein
MTDVRSEPGTAPSTDDPSGTDVDPGAAGLGEHERAVAAKARLIASRRPKPTRVVAARVSIWLRLGEMWRARELFVFLVRKEIKVKYKNSALGFLWSMLNPALTLAVFYVLFTFFLPNGIPNFVIYMFSAMLVWNLFQTAVPGPAPSCPTRPSSRRSPSPARSSPSPLSGPPSCSSCSSPSFSSPS